jgi:hypothetical protein
LVGPKTSYGPPQAHSKRYDKPPNGRAPRFLKNKNKGTQSQYFRPLQTLSCTSESSCFRLSHVLQNQVTSRLVWTDKKTSAKFGFRGNAQSTAVMLQLAYKSHTTSILWYVCVFPPSHFAVDVDCSHVHPIIQYLSRRSVFAGTRSRPRWCYS